ncbi:hypothetical protein PF006_g26362 [Phytophthora fragariae]|uniref:Uncharacterized protein n=1 Tax=Phytophthora fragariae TaxID=53985 RepID=A0A6A3QY71_9STRA|nr:hypothetical protein PF003_g32872 [Phytophthora fragariae]KAE9084950.1 hypothetical protein PF006_g26362 [Phytophthora fragariae]
MNANYEHRTEFSAAGPARTLKLGLTDGHLDLRTTCSPIQRQRRARHQDRGGERAREVLLAPDNCQLLETTTDQPTRGKRKYPVSMDAPISGSIRIQGRRRNRYQN